MIAATLMIIVIFSTAIFIDYEAKSLKLNTRDGKSK